VQFGPIVTEGNEAHVHHLVVYICSGINDSHIGNGGDCKDDAFEFQVRRCRSGTFIAAWAVGGEVSKGSLLAHDLAGISGIICKANKVAL
jgi:hypothetical protein